MSEQLEQGAVSANGIDFAYLAAGPADGPLALCLHGYPDSAWTWRHLLPELAAAGYRAVAPFNRGYAPTSVAADGRYQAGVLGQDANALHEALGAGPDAVLVGHDWGAMGAYAATGTEPGRWRKVVAAAVPPGPVTAQAFFSYDQLKLSFYMFFQLTPLADMAVPLNDYEFVRRLWEDWSPGYDGAEDFARFVGKAVRVRTHAPIDGKRTFLGVLVDATPERIEIEDASRGRVVVALADVDRANYEHEFAAGARRRRA